MDETGFNPIGAGYGRVYGRGNSRISLFQPATTLLKVVNMSATIARQGGCVQRELSDMHLALNVPIMANGGFSRAAIERTQYLIKEPRAEVQEEEKRGVEFPGHK